MSQAKKTQLRILVADDDPDTLHTFALLLREIGHQVDVAANAQAALALVRRALPHIVFLDIGMPDMDGWQLASLLRREFGEAAFRLVAITGYGDAESHVRSRKAGFDAHVTKPIDMTLLDSIIAQVSLRTSGGR